MPFETHWINAPYILGTDFVGMVTSGELNIAMLEHLGTVQVHAAYILLDFSHTRALPNKLFDIESCEQLLLHDNTQWLAVVSPRGFNSHTTRLLARDKVKLFNDRESAVVFLRAMVRSDKGIIISPVEDQ